MQHDAELLIMCNALQKPSRRRYQRDADLLTLCNALRKASKRKYAAQCAAASLVQCTAESQ